MIQTSSFTFHYVSTYTLSLSFLSQQIHLFTFHYVSTYTKLTLAVLPLAVPHLHSTMFLLIPMPQIVKMRERSRFTFHYVSTYTSPRDTQRDEESKFTFHYVSTYTLSWIPESFPRCLIYIPLCFYLYAEPFGNIKEDNLIYIPLCFYLYAGITNMP